MTVDKIPRSTFREHIAEKLRAQILSGELPPGSAIVEGRLAEKFEVSRGPLREAIRQLTEEGLLVNKAYTATSVMDLSVEAASEIFAMRTALEVFAFELCWNKRGPAFHREMTRRHDALTSAIDAGDGRLAMVEELELHSLAYEASGNSLLLSVWKGMRGRLQLYWAAHHRAHGRRMPLRTAHEHYVELACGTDLVAMVSEIKSHMRQGEARTQEFLEASSAKRDADEVASLQAVSGLLSRP